MGGVYGFQDVQDRSFIIGGNLGYVQFVWNGSASNTVNIAKVSGNGYVLSANPNVPSTDVFIGYAGNFNLYLFSTLQYLSLNYSITSTITVNPNTYTTTTIPFVLYGESSALAIALSTYTTSTVAVTVNVAVAWSITD